MKPSIPFLLFFTLASPCILFGQKSNEELLKWDEVKKLTWADYKSKPNPESDAAASTTTYLSVDYNITSTHFGFKVQSYFSKTRSWGLHKTDYILSHEQGHFDIAEVFARKLQKKLGEYKLNKKTYQNDLKKIYDGVTKEKSDAQNDYDRETNHSINKTKQAEWLKKIEEMLKEYANYDDY
jgi:hypothetical protein